MDKAIWIDDASLESVDVVGFDLDHALGRYDTGLVSKLVFDGLVEYMTSDELGYPVSVFEGGFDGEFVARGLLMDLETGNILKLDVDGRVSMASHGTRMLTEEEMDVVYGVERKWREDDLSALRDVRRHPSFFAFVTFFDAAASLAFARMVDAIDLGTAPAAKGDALAAVERSGGNAYARLLPEMIPAFNYIFDNVESLKHGRGAFMRAMAEAPEEVVVERRRMRSVLEELRKRGKQVFLATNSQSEFARLVVRCSLGEDWRGLFDFVVVDAGKGGFFKGVTGFLVDFEGGEKGGEEKTATTIALDGKTVFVHGNASALQALFDAKKYGRNPNPVISIDGLGHVIGGAVLPPLRTVDEESDVFLKNFEGGDDFEGVSSKKLAAEAPPKLVTEAPKKLVTEAPQTNSSSSKKLDPKSASLLGADEEVEETGGVVAVLAGEKDEEVEEFVVPREADVDVVASLFEARHHARVLYVGDHPHSDVVAARKYMGWRSCAIVEELRTREDEGLRRLMEHAKLHIHHEEPAEKDNHIQLGAKWGSFFWCKDKPSWFGNLVVTWPSLILSDAELLHTILE